MNKPPLIILTGPTAAGKTELSIQLAKKINGEIISADSMQVYRGMDIGTAKITKEQMLGVPHHLIDILNPDEEFNVMLFQEKAKACIQDIYRRKKIPIIAGGTGFYIQAVLYDICFAKEETDKAYRRELEQLAKEKGTAFLHEMLREVDEKSAAAIHPNNVKRVIRALEYHHETKETISSHNETERLRTSPYAFCYYVLTMDRDILYRRIDERVDIMLQNGLAGEVQALYEKGYAKDLVSMQGLGYKELYRYFAGELTLEEAVYIIKRDTRHFAKRQLTWFRREKEVTWLDKGEFNSEGELLSHILDDLKEKHIINEYNGEMKE